MQQGLVGSRCVDDLITIDAEQVKIKKQHLAPVGQEPTENVFS